MKINLKQAGRRRFIKASMAAVPVVLVGSPALADDMPHLTTDDPTANALGYVEDTNSVDAARFPNHTAEQKCANCQLMTADGTEEWLPCSLFPGKAVAADGWCSAWVQKP